MSFIRVHDQSTGAVYTSAEGAPRGADVVVLDAPAVDRQGRPLPPEFKSSAPRVRGKESQKFKADTIPAAVSTEESA